MNFITLFMMGFTAGVASANLLAGRYSVALLWTGAGMIWCWARAERQKRLRAEQQARDNAPRKRR